MYTTWSSTEAGLPSIQAAQAAIAGIACRTPLVLAAMPGADGRDVRLKLETVQPTGAFKIRGAANALARLDQAASLRGVICASTGNHGRALAYAARRLGISATVCLSRLVPPNKRDAVQRLGAAVRIVGESQDDAQAECARLAAEDGLTEIPPFDHPDIIAGQATIGLELLEDFPDLDTVVVPVSGGGLIAGIAAAVKAARPGTRVVGVSMERGAAMAASLAAGRPVEVKEEASLADSLGGGIGRANRLTFAMVRALVDEIVLVPEAAIARAMRRLFLEQGLVTEGAGAIGLALLERPHASRLGGRVAIVVSGRNVDMTMFRRIVDDAAALEAP